MENTCEICNAKSGNTLLSGKELAVLLSEKPAAPGHSLVVPQSHTTILEQVSDIAIGNLMSASNKVSVAIFEAFNAHGTNILIQNGLPAGQTDPHFSINIIPRFENDGLDFNWKPQQFSEEQMSTVELKIKELTEGIGMFEKEKKEPVKLDKDVEKIKDSEENYLIKQLRRIP